MAIHRITYTDSIIISHHFITVRESQMANVTTEQGLMFAEKSGRQERRVCFVCRHICNVHIPSSESLHSDHSPTVIAEQAVVIMPEEGTVGRKNGMENPNL